MAYRPKDTQERILHRLKIIQGHLKKIIGMVENDEYCINILHQSQAVQKALKEADNVLLENHLRFCLSQAVSDHQKDKAIAEVIEIFQKAN